MSADREARFPLLLPGPFFRVVKPAGDLVTDSLESYAEAVQYRAELADDGFDITDAVIVRCTEERWLARCSQCGVEAVDHAEGGTLDYFADVVWEAAEINRDMEEMEHTALNEPYWFVHLPNRDLRCVDHVPAGAGYVRADAAMGVSA